MDFLIASIHSSLSCFEVALIRYVLQLLRVAGRLSTGIAGSVYVYTVQYTMALRTHTQHGSGGTPAGRSVSCQAYFTTTTTYKWKLDKTETSQVDKGDLMVCVCYITSLRVAACQISLLLSHHVYHAHTLTLTHILTHTHTLSHTHTHYLAERRKLKAKSKQAVNSHREVHNLYMEVMCTPSTSRSTLELQPTCS